MSTAVIERPATKTMKEIKMKISELVRQYNEGKMDLNWSVQREFLNNKRFANKIHDSLENSIFLGTLHLAEFEGFIRILDGMQRINTFVNMAKEGFDFGDKTINVCYYTNISDLECRKLFDNLNSSNPMSSAYRGHSVKDGINDFIDELFTKYTFLSQVRGYQSKPLTKQNQFSFYERCICIALNNEMPFGGYVTVKMHGKYSQEPVSDEAKEKILEVFDYLQWEFVGDFGDMRISPANLLDLFLLIFFKKVKPTKTNWIETEPLRLARRAYKEATISHTNNVTYIHTRHKALIKTLG